MSKLHSKRRSKRQAKTRKQLDHYHNETVTYYPEGRNQKKANKKELGSGDLVAEGIDFQLYTYANHYPIMHIFYRNGIEVERVNNRDMTWFQLYKKHTE